MGKRRISIEELRDEIELQQIESYCSGFTIREYLKTKINVYAVDNLMIDIEDGYIMFYSSTNNLRGYFLQKMMDEWIISIESGYVDNLLNSVIHSKYGDIYINAIM
ncbi:MAG: hypothetical protein LBE23_05945 [Vagococcus sp.]|jgi:hypothetical protein|nr:hypothetical protein [Vagococcus sp.]